MLRLFWVFCLLAVGRGEVAQINGAIDKILHQAQQDIVKNNDDVLSIPEFIDETFTYRWHLFKFEATLQCWEGMMSNTSTLQRAGDVQLAYTSNQTIMIVPLNLTDFQMFFNSCRIDIHQFLKKTSPVYVEIARNVLEAKVVIDETNEDCTVTLETFGVTKAERVTFESSYLFEEVHDRVLPYLTKNFIRQLVPFLSSHFKDLIKDYIPNGKLCYKQL